MSYTKYTKQEFEELADDGQINIMALFGNGVDIQLMEYLKSPYRTSYQNFYNYLCYKNFSKDNIIFTKMTKDKEKNEKWPGSKQNWSDFESGLIEIFNGKDQINEEKLTDDFNQFQVEFSNFLNDIITPNMLAQLGKDSSKSELAISSFQKFLADLDESNFRKLSFPKKLNHYKLFNWEILNFNYTSMLDNILRVEIPTQTVNVEKNGKTKEVEENRFPGYVLVEMVMTDEAWFVVRNTPNVTGFVGSHGNRSKPTPLLEEEIRNILISMGQTVQEFDIHVKVGDTVRIIDGAFTDYTGKITEIDNNKVKMVISMFGNDTIAEVNLNQIAEL